MYYMLKVMLILFNVENVSATGWQLYVYSEKWRIIDPIVVSPLNYKFIWIIN